MGRVLFGKEAEDKTPREMLDVLTAMLLTADAAGNALLEAPSVADGRGVVAVHAPDGVHVPSDAEAAAEAAEEDASPSVREYHAVRGHLRAQCAVCCPRNPAPDATDSNPALRIWRTHMRGSAAAGLHGAVKSGPLAEEPVRSLLVLVEGVECSPPPPPLSPAPAGGGRLVSALRQGVRACLLSRPARVAEAHLALHLHAPADALGAAFAVLARRRGRVTNDAAVEGTDLLLITAAVPQGEVFGITQELMKKTSGGASTPEMTFSHWEVLGEDPFWIPTTEEEREDYGEIRSSGDASTGINNRAISILRSVRKRKGLPVDEAKLVVAAEKQRTLNRKR
mmetsp:Transcript_22646/g.51887  ORF Transcript_22646/g.51887 Transcript_22646/m.51887 type:complete len:338 (-) Transcript_22646:818-1831(-)